MGDPNENQISIKPGSISGLMPAGQPRSVPGCPHHCGNSQSSWYCDMANQRRVLVWPDQSESGDIMTQVVRDTVQTSPEHNSPVTTVTTSQVWVCVTVCHQTDCGPPWPGLLSGEAHLLSSHLESDSEMTDLPPRPGSRYLALVTASSQPWLMFQYAPGPTDCVGWPSPYSCHCVSMATSENLRWLEMLIQSSEDIAVQCCEDLRCRVVRHIGQLSYHWLMYFLKTSYWRRSLPRIPSKMSWRLCQRETVCQAFCDGRARQRRGEMSWVGPVSSWIWARTPGTVAQPVHYYLR